jgi:AcrR family transcriptional regulator
MTSPPVAPVAATARGRFRRQRILDAAAELVAARGFHSVGVADIGAAAGVTGPAIYRHFRTKQDVLVALIERVVDQLLDGARGVVGSTDDPDEALQALIRAHVEFALRDRSIIAVYDQEANQLPDHDRRRLRRQQRLYTEIWADVLAAGWPDRPRGLVLASAHAVFGLLNSVADYHAQLPDRELGDLLHRMARASLAASG